MRDSFQFDVVFVNNKKHLKLASESYYRHYINTKTKVGDKGSMTLSFKKTTRSESQLNYYFVICSLLGDHTGYSKDEVHEALMILKWGTKNITIGKDRVSVRKSISDAAKIPKNEMSEQIEFALEKCTELGVVVPTPAELGYVSNH